MLLSGCADRRPLTISLHPWVGYETLNLADEFGWLPANVRLSRVETMDESVEALRSGRVDAAAMTLDQMLQARAGGECFSAIAVFDVSAGGDMVLGQPHVQGMVDMAGRRVGLVESTLSYLVLGHALDRVGLTLEDVELVPLQGRDPQAAWLHDGLDAIVIYEPDATALRRIGAELLFDTRHLPDLIFDVLVARCGSRRQATLRKVLEAHFRAIDYIRANPDDARYRIAANENLSYADVVEVLGGVVLPGRLANQSYLSDGSPLYGAAKEIAAFLHDSGVLVSQDDLKRLADPQFLPRGR